MRSADSKPAVLRSFTLLLSATVGIGWAVNYLRDFANEYSGMLYVYHHSSRRRHRHH
jgi:hypothetical protein